MRKRHPSLCQPRYATRCRVDYLTKGNDDVTHVAYPTITNNFFNRPSEILTDETLHLPFDFGNDAHACCCSLGSEMGVIFYMDGGSDYTDTVNNRKARRRRGDKQRHSVTQPLSMLLKSSRPSEALSYPPAATHYWLWNHENNQCDAYLAPRHRMKDCS